MIIPAILKRIDASLAHLVHRSLAGTWTGILKQVTALATVQVNRKCMTLLTDEPVFATHLDSLVAKDVEVSIQFNGISLLITHGNNSALPRR